MSLLHPGEHSVLRWGFRSKKQLPLLMIWREVWDGEELLYAYVIFNSMSWFGV